MKKIKYLLLVVVCIFTININVKAAEYAYCYYNYTPSDAGFKIKSGLSKKTASLVALIGYEEGKFATPQLVGRLISTSDLNLSDGYTNELSSNVKSESLDCLNTNTTCFYDPPTLNLEQLKSYTDKSKGTYKLVCPNIYLFKTTAGSKTTYLLALTPDSRNINGTKFEEYKIISYDKTYSKISNNSSSTPENNNIATTCNYNYSGYSSGGQMYTSSGTLGFSIMNDGTVSSIFATGGLQVDKIKYDGGTISSKTCPNYLKLNKHTGLTESYIGLTIGTESSYNAVYNGNISNAEENANPSTSVTRYVEFSGSSNSIVVEKVGGNYTISFKNGSSEKAISVNNLSNSDIQAKLNSANYPKYLVKIKGSDTYTFTDTKPNEFDKIYMNVSALNSIQGLGEAEIYKTCEEIFGESFLKWLDENVFMIIRIGVPILLILLTSFDFAKVVFNDDKEGMSNAFKRFTKRAIAAVLIFLTPTIIMLIANLIGGDELTAVTDCVNYIENMHE